MTQHKRFTTGLATIGLIIGTQAAMANPAEPAFRIMSDEEIATHSEAMRSLQGAARDDYRNAQYDLLRQRALEQGYAMPATPPWDDATSPVPPTATAAETPAPTAAVTEAEARHAKMREKMQAHREAVQPSTPTQETAATEPAAIPPQETVTEIAAEQAAEPAAPAETQSVATIETDALNTDPLPETPVASEPPPPPSADSASVAVIEVEPEVSPSAGADEAAPIETADAASKPSPDAIDSYAKSEAMRDYRETMRARFDEYMRERQTQIDETVRRQRERHEAAFEQNRAVRPQSPAYRPYPPMPPVYGPAYPGAFPGYGVPYWQPPR